VSTDFAEADAAQPALPSRPPTLTQQVVDAARRLFFQRVPRAESVRAQAVLRPWDTNERRETMTNNGGSCTREAALHGFVLVGISSVSNS